MAKGRSAEGGSRKRLAMNEHCSWRTGLQLRKGDLVWAPTVSSVNAFRDLIFSFLIWVLHKKSFGEPSLLHSARKQPPKVHSGFEHPPGTLTVVTQSRVLCNTSDCYQLPMPTQKCPPQNPFSVGHLPRKRLGDSIQ